MGELRFKARLYEIKKSYFNLFDGYCNWDMIQRKITFPSFVPINDSLLLILILTETHQTKTFSLFGVECGVSSYFT